MLCIGHIDLDSADVQHKMTDRGWIASIRGRDYTVKGVGRELDVVNAILSELPAQPAASDGIANIRVPAYVGMLRSGQVLALHGHVDALSLPELARAQPRRMRPQLAAQLLLEISRGLGALHRLNIVHSHLVPESVRCRKSAVGWTVSIDAESARYGEHDMSWQNSFSPRYVSPSRWRNAMTPSEGDDYYALGAIAYELVVGEEFFSCPSPGGGRLSISEVIVPMVEKDGQSSPKLGQAVKERLPHAVENVRDALRKAEDGWEETDKWLRFFEVLLYEEKALRSLQQSICINDCDAPRAYWLRWLASVARRRDSAFSPSAKFRGLGETACG